MTVLTTGSDFYVRQLPPGEVVEFATTPLDVTGVPAWSAAWRGPDGWHTGLGYGVDEEAARLSAWGEAAESALLTLALQEATPVRASYRALLRDRGDRGVVDPMSLCLEAGSAYSDDRVLDWVPMARWETGEEVLVPVDVAAPSGGALPAAACDVPGGRLLTLITNGDGAGDSPERAVAHALGELLQRDGNGLRFRALDAGVVVDLGPGDADVQDPATRELLHRLRGLGIAVTPKLASTEDGVSNLYVVGDDPTPPQPVMATAAGEAASLDRESALRKAVLEFAAARARKAFMHGPLADVARIAPEGYLDRFRPDLAAQEPRALREMLRWLALPTDELREVVAPAVRTRRETVRFADLPTDDALAGPRETLQALLELLRGKGLDVLVLLARQGDAYAAKVVVPGLEVETMSYGRIGERNVRRLLDAGDGTTGLHGIAGLGAPPAGAVPVLLRDDAVERLGGRPWFDRAAVDAVVGPLYPLYREPGRHAVQALLEEGR